VFILACALLLGGDSMAEKARLAVTADTSISCYETERDLNAGGSPRIKLKGAENYIFLDFDRVPLAGKKVVAATLHIRGTASNMMVRKVGVSTVAVPWGEGAQDYGKAGPAESTFFSPGAEGAKGWTGPGLDFTYAAFGRAGTLWNSVYAAREKDEWYSIKLDPRYLEACVAGLSFGLALSDDCGQNMNIAPELPGALNRSNNYFFSREQSSDAPYIEVETSSAAPTRAVPVGKLKVNVAPWPAGADIQRGGLAVEWDGPKSKAVRESLLGYRVKVDGVEVRDWMVPGIPPVGERARWLVRLDKPGARVTVEVVALARRWSGGWAGSASGTVSPVRAAVAPIALAALPVSTGGPVEAAQARVWAVPDLAKVNPLTGNVLEEPGVDYLGEATGKWRDGNGAWDGKAHAVTVAALRGEWIAFQLVIERAGREPASFRLAPGGFGGLPGSLRIYRAWYQKTGAGEREWYADPLVPISADGAVSVPDAMNAVPGQRNQAVYVEYRVPADAKPGEYSAEIAIEPGGTRIPVRLKVGAGMLPQAAAFTWSLNAYSSPGWGFGRPGEPGFREAERAFYAMAHEHRANLAALHYSHSGNFEPGCVPAVTGKGKAMRVKDWKEWDERFGPLFDGSAFAGTGRESVPLDHFFLALSENYPTTMAEGYKWNNLKWEEHWLKAGPVEEGFSARHGEQWVAVAKDYIRHIREKGWKTRFQVYLNDKYFYKQYDSNRKAWGQGVSFWLLDEPMHTDDFLALSHFGRLLRQAQEGDRSRVVFRVDLSCPERGRDTLDRVMDLDISGGYRRYPELLDGWRNLYGHKAWTYGDLPRSTESGLGLVAQALDLYSRGVDGYVPWLVLGGEENWKEFVTTCLLYPGKPFGVTGPCPSLRLKAMRRGEQDVEYVALLTEKRGLVKDDPRRQNIAALLGKGPGAVKTEGRLDAQGAITESYSGTRLDEFEWLRRAITAELAN